MKKVLMEMVGFQNQQLESHRLPARRPITLGTAFERIAKTLPDGAKISFYKTDNGIAPCIHLYAAHDEPKLSYEFFAAHRSVVIRRIHSGEERRTGLGTAMIASQMPFWQQMGASRIGVLATELSKGFYEKLGFVRVSLLNEYPWNRQSLLIPMRVDLESKQQNKRFNAALQKAPRLTGQSLTL